jgi:hypothetical protein
MGSNCGKAYKLIAFEEAVYSYVLSFDLCTEIWKKYGVNLCPGLNKDKFRVLLLLRRGMFKDGRTSSR